MATCKPAGRDEGGPSRSLLAILREPITQFLFLGLVTWIAVTSFDRQRSRLTIEITPAQAQQIADAHARQLGERPTPAHLRGLLQRYVRDEIAYREGLAEGLHHDDEIVRRRIIQKYRFLQSDRAVPDQPSDAELSNWYAGRLAHYREPARISFAHIYFSPDRGGSAAARARAEVVLSKLGKRNRAPELGDAFPGPSDAVNVLPEEIIRVFGESSLVDEIRQLSPGRWAGPFESGYGWHLIYVNERTPAATPLLAEIHDQVLSDYLASQRAESNAETFDELRARYRILYNGEPL